MQFNEDLDFYYQLCIDDRVTCLFRDTLLGVKYWRDHQKHTCYECRRKGHIAKDCAKVCLFCGKIHGGPICASKMMQYMENIRKIIRKSKTWMRKYKEINEIEQKIIKEVQEEYKEKININKRKFNVNHVEALQFVNNNNNSIENKKSSFKSQRQDYFILGEKVQKSNILSLFEWLLGCKKKEKREINDQVGTIRKLKIRVEPLFVTRTNYYKYRFDFKTLPASTFTTNQHQIKIEDQKYNANAITKDIVQNALLDEFKIEKERINKKYNKLISKGLQKYLSNITKIKDLKDLDDRINMKGKVILHKEKRIEEIDMKIVEKLNVLHQLKDECYKYTCDTKNYCQVILDAAYAKGEAIKNKAVIRRNNFEDMMARKSFEIRPGMKRRTIENKLMCQKEYEEREPDDRTFDEWYEDRKKAIEEEEKEVEEFRQWKRDKDNQEVGKGKSDEDSNNGADLYMNGMYNDF